MVSFAFVPRTHCICGTPLACRTPRAEQSAEIVRHLPYGEVRFRRCAACGSWLQAPVLNPAALAAWCNSPDYQGSEHNPGIGYADYARDERQRAIEARHRYRHDIAPHLPKQARVLEVGCASGTLLGEIARHGHSVLGCDLSERFAQTARRLHNIDVAVADWLDLDVPDATLDAILLLGTISNLPRLDESLARARRQLRPGGMLFFNFPAADSLVARLYGSRMWMFAPSVMQFMTRGGITTALDRAGFRIASSAIDRQAPGFGKILGHARLMRLYPLFARLGLIDAAIPLALPIPGVYAVRAVRPN